MPPHSTEVSHATDDLVSWGSDLCSKMVFEQLSCTQPEVVKRRVTICEEVQVFEIPHVSTFSRECIRDCYFSRAEIGSIHQKAWEIVDHMNLGVEYKDEPNFCKRGLVDLKDTSMQRRKRFRTSAYKVVFGVQSVAAGKKRMECMDSTEVLADLYRAAAAPSKKEAYMTGIRDAIAAGMALSL
eukprot:scaffold22648_cov114-Cylindrotheca_fusiformis.AAC.3